MAKKNKHIDDLFKDNLQGAPLPLDGSEWGRLLSEIQPEKKKRFVWWWWLFGALIVCALGLLVNNLVTPKTGNGTVLTVKDSSNNLPKVALTDDDIQGDKTVKKDTTNFANKSISTNDNDGFVKSTIGKQTNTIESKPSVDNSSKVNYPGPVVSIGTDLRKAKQVLVSLDPISMVVLAIEYPNYLHTPYPSGRTRASYCSPYNLLRSNDTIEPMFVNPYIGILGGLTQFNQNITSSDNRYKLYRGQNESNALLPNVGIELGAGFKGFEVSSGINYQVKGQESSSLFRYEIYDSLPKVDIITNDTTWLPYNYRDTIVSGISSPRYQFITLPITIGKTLYSNDTWDLSVGALTQVQYLFGGSGSILSDQLNIIKIEDLSAFNRLSLSYGGYIGIGYTIQGRTKLKLVTRYNTDAVNMFSASTNKQKLSGIGADISVQFKLRKK